MTLTTPFWPWLNTKNDLGVGKESNWPISLLTLSVMHFESKRFVRTSSMYVYDKHSAKSTSDSTRALESAADRAYLILFEVRNSIWAMLGWVMSESSATNRDFICKRFQPSRCKGISLNFWIKVSRDFKELQFSQLERDKSYNEQLCDFVHTQITTIECW